MIAISNQRSQLVTAQLALSRFTSLCTTCAGVGTTIGGTPTNASFTAGYNACVNGLTALGFNPGDADEIAKAACMTIVDAMAISPPPAMSLAEQWASAAALATAIGKLASPGDCSGACSTAQTNAMAAALAATSVANQPALAITMWSSCMNLGVIS